MEEVHHINKTANVAYGLKEGAHNKKLYIHLENMFTVSDSSDVQQESSVQTRKNLVVNQI